MQNYCRQCGKPLKRPESQQIGLGPICAAKCKDKAATQPEEDKYDLPWNWKIKDIICKRDPNGTKHFNFHQLYKHHSPMGMEWGYAGSGAADFALNALFKLTGIKEVAWTFHQAFKEKFVANLPEEGGIIKGTDAMAWLVQQLINRNPES